MSRRLLAVACVLFAALAGCARPGAGPGGPAAPAVTGSPVVHPQWTSCKDQAGTDRAAAVEDMTTAVTLPRLPADFTPAAAVVCAYGMQQRAGGGEDQVLTERRATDVSRLTAALRLPDQPKTDGACTANLVGVVWFALFDTSGRWLRPGVAVNPCGQPRQEVLQALEDLTTTTVATTVIGTITSDEAAKAGCGMGYAELVGVEAGEGRVKDGPVQLSDGDVRVCIYTVPKEEQGTGKPAGRFERGGRLTADAWAPLRATIQQAGPIVPCTVHASRFALIGRPDNPGGEVSLELDGCHRLLIETGQGSVLKQGDATLADRVAKSV